VPPRKRHIATATGRGSTYPAANPVQTNPASSYHGDGCNGLSPLGSLIFLSWIFAILLASAIYVVLFLGYLGIEKTEIGLALTVIALLTVLFTAVVPLRAAVKAVIAARDLELGRLEPLLNETFAHAFAADISNSNQLHVRQLSRLQEIHKFLAEINVWPFNPRALKLIIVIYTIQLLAILRELIGSGANKIF
jgi:hypothetical protein